MRLLKSVFKIEYDKWLLIVFIQMEYSANEISIFGTYERGPKFL